MNCPICNKEMEKGVVQSARTIFFTTEPHNTFFIPSGDDITISKHNFVRPSCTAYICKACKKVVIDYFIEQPLAECN